MNHATSPWRTHSCVPCRDSELLRSAGISESTWKLHELVGQVGNLRPIVNRLSGALAASQAGRLAIGRRFPTCPTSSCRIPRLQEFGDSSRHVFCAPGTVRRRERRRGTHECVRHGGSGMLTWLYADNYLKCRSG